MSVRQRHKVVDRGKTLGWESWKADFNFCIRKTILVWVGKVPL